MARRRKRKVVCSIVLHVMSDERPVRVAIVQVGARNVGKAVAVAKARALEQLKVRK